VQSIFAVIGLVGILITVGYAIAAYSAADEYFAEIVAKHPELAGTFPKPNPFFRPPIPIRPSYFDFLEAKRHLSLPEVVLQQRGSQILFYLQVHAVCLALSILSLLVWNYLGRA
jgi:hypothetical protein